MYIKELFSRIKKIAPYFCITHDDVFKYHEEQDRVLVINDRLGYVAIFDFKLGLYINFMGGEEIE